MPLNAAQRDWLEDLFKDNERLRDALTGITEDVKVALEDGMLPRSDYIDSRVAQCEEALAAQTRRRI